MLRLLHQLKSLFSRKQDPSPVAFVWFLDSPRFLDAPSLHRLVEQELGLTLLCNPEEGDVTDDAAGFVMGQVPNFVVHLGDLVLLVNTFPAPYMDHPERQAKKIDELRVRKAVAEHRAWISADLLGEYEGEALAEGLRTIGRLAAALADERCLALYLPHENRLIPYAPELVEQLRSPDPVGALSWGPGPVVPVRENDPAMQAAVAEARTRWPEFVAAFRNPQPGQASFAVKLPVTDGQNTEFIWVSVASLDGDEILGDLANEPVELRFMKEGDRVRGRVAELNDWMWIEGGDFVGGFTVKVLLEAQKKR